MEFIFEVYFRKDLDAIKLLFLGENLIQTSDLSKLQLTFHFRRFYTDRFYENNERTNIRIEKTILQRQEQCKCPSQTDSFFVFLNLKKNIPKKIFL